MGYSPWGRKESDMTEETWHRGGNGNPFQDSRLESPMDGIAKVLKG